MGPSPSTPAPCDFWGEVAQSSFGNQFSRAVDGLADAQVRTAAAKVSDFPLNVSVGWIGVLGEQSCGRHNLSRLAIAALRYIPLPPRDLHRVLTAGRQTLDGGNLLSGCLADASNAGPNRFSV